jgi:hypothetical protein
MRMIPRSGLLCGMMLSLAASAAVAQPVHVMQIVDEEVELQEVAYNTWIESATYGVNGSDVFEIGYPLLDVGEGVEFTLEYTAYEDDEPVATQVLYYTMSYLDPALGCSGQGCAGTNQWQCEEGYPRCASGKICNGRCVTAYASCDWRDSKCSCPILDIDCGGGGTLPKIELETCYGDTCSLTVTPVEISGNRTEP